MSRTDNRRDEEKKQKTKTKIAFIFIKPMDYRTSKAFFHASIILGSNFRLCKNAGEFGTVPPHQKENKIVKR
ncbi:hypothetical protein Leryth_009931 [Lithospermum erythrorhizon]|nr:hypothetical protein Leryth_009931 [Lithospermum erythrorhizon]